MKVINGNTQLVKERYNIGGERMLDKDTLISVLESHILHLEATKQRFSTQTNTSMDEWYQGMCDAYNNEIKSLTYIINIFKTN